MSYRNGFLTEEELELCRIAREAALPDTYTLPEFLADVWEYILGKTGFGRRFRRSVEAGQLSGIDRSGRTVTNHQIYTIRAA